MSTQQLVDAILKKSPNSDPETVLEVLVSCNGDIDQAFRLLGVTCASQQRQTTLSGFKVEKNTGKRASGAAIPPPKRSHLPVVDLFTPQQVKDAGIDCVLIESVLEPTLANTVLMELMDQSRTWRKQEFILFDREVTSPHLSAIYSSSSTQSKSVSYQGQEIEARPFTLNLSEARDEVQKLVCGELASEVLEGAAARSDASIAQPSALDIDQERAAHCPGPARDSTGQSPSSKAWYSDYAVANRYDGPNSGVGFHSDQLTHLGPKPIIAGLSLGASREFRLKRRSEKRGAKQYSIHCKHNTLVIMLPGCQERWKHSVPPVKGVGPHALVGATRISLTFRMYPDKFKLENLPKCRCNKPMLLRTTTQENYKYIWQCGQSYVSKDSCEMVTEAKF